MFKEAGIDPNIIDGGKQDETIPEIDLDAKLASRKVKNQNLEAWIIYPEDNAKSGWDIIMTW